MAAFVLLLQRLPLHFLAASNLLVQHFCLTLALHQREMIGMPTSMTAAAAGAGVEGVAQAAAAGAQTADWWLQRRQPPTCVKESFKINDSRAPHALLPCPR